jgi:hypothetical protein
VNYQSGAPFVPANGSARWTKGLLLATLVLSVVGIASGLLQIDLLSRAASEGISEAEAASNDTRQQVVGVLQGVVYLGTAVAFLTWFYRVHKNLSALRNRSLKYSPGWAVGGFFVPFLNLVRPFQVMCEVWHGSDPDGVERDSAPERAAIRDQLGTPALVGWWWALFLISGIAGNIVTRMSFSADLTLQKLQVLSVLLVCSDLLDVLAAIVAVRLVSRVTDRQSERAERVR